jgi:ketosteroid isomerase-like protein
MGEDDDYQRILKLHHAWIEAELRGDVASLLRMCSDEIRFFPPNAKPVEGKSAISTLLQNDLQLIEKIETYNLEIEISGNLAYKTASFVTHVKSNTYEGNHLWILRRYGFDWQLIIVAWSLIT